MAVLLRSATLRELAHALLDKLLDECTSRELRSRPIIRMEDTVEPVTPRGPAAPTAKPRITADEPAQKLAHVKRETQFPVNFRDVSMSCYRSSDNLRVGIHISAAVASRLGLKKGGFAELRFPASGVMTIKSARDGVSVLSYGGNRLTMQILAKRVGILGKHRSESVVHHFGLEDELSITLPAWWPKGKQAAQKPKDGTPVSCKKMAGTNPTIKCAACQKATATVECSRCPTLLCDACWDPHVRTHWHAKAGDKAITAARDAHHAMRNEA